jgi:hypothetical protein
MGGTFERQRDDMGGAFFSLGNQGRNLRFARIHFALPR